MKVTDLIIDPKSFGSQMWLVNIEPAYAYRDNVRTNDIVGYRYVVALPEKGLEKVSVKIEGEQRIELPKMYAEVVFDGLEIFVYWANGQLVVGARAKDIHVVNSTTKD